MAEKEIVSGHSDSRFYPDNPIKRAEFLRMLLSSLGIGIDISTGGDWWTPYANVATEKNIINDAELTNSSQADEFISTEQALLWLEKAIKGDDIFDLDSGDFIDNISKDLSLDSTHELTRGLAAEILYKVINI